MTPWSIVVQFLSDFVCALIIAIVLSLLAVGYWPRVLVAASLGLFAWFAILLFTLIVRPQGFFGTWG